MSTTSDLQPGDQGQAFGKRAISRTLLLVVGFGVHVVVGTMLFAAIAAAAMFLEHALTWMNLGDEAILAGLKSAEQVVFWLDLFTFVIFIARSTYRFSVEIWEAI